MDFKILPFEFKATDTDGGSFAGYANAFNNIDSAQEIVVPGAFKDTLAEFLSDGFIGGLNHDWSSPIGKPTSAREDAKGLFIEVKISNTQHGMDCRTLLKDGVIKKMSIGYRVLGDQNLENADEVSAYWKSAGYAPTTEDIARSKYGARLLTRISLMEASPVTVPANSMADITRVKRYDAGEIKTERDFEKFLREAGKFSRKEAVIISVSGFKALPQRDADEDTPDEPLPTTPELTTTPDPDTDTQEDASEQVEPTTTTASETQEETPVETVAVVEVVPVVETPSVNSGKSGVNQDEVRALYASLLTQQAASYLPR